MVKKKQPKNDFLIKEMVANCKLIKRGSKEGETIIDNTIIKWCSGS